MTLESKPEVPGEGGLLIAYPPTLGEARYLSDAELELSLKKTLAMRATGDEFWIFAYGSLIWRPDLPTLETARARVQGYHRGLYLWSRVNRGTPQTPGLVLALDRGGSCKGLAFRIDPTQLDEALRTLWLREMPMGSYQPSWLRCTLADGRRIQALSFVMRRGIPTYAGRLPDAVLRTVLERASGRYGTTHEYVARTVHALREHGIVDLALESLLKRCS
jgi:cation transport protein ChaC